MERYNYEQDESYIRRLREYIEKLEEENKRLKEAVEIADMCVNNTTKKNKKLESKIHKLGIRIYQNIDGEKRKEYQEYCKRHKLESDF